MFSFYNLVLCEQDLEKENSEEENVKLTKGEQKPSAQRGGPSSNVDKAKGSKKRVMHQSLERKNLVRRGRKRGLRK
jgi:hypothetical protein